MNPLADTSFAFKKAHTIIWKHGNWKFLLVPILLSACLLPLLAGLMFFLSYALGGAIEGWLTDEETASGWIRYGVMALMMTGLFGSGYVLYKHLIMVCYGPFLDRLTMQAEKLIKGTASESDRPLMESLSRPLMILLYAVAASISTILISLILGLIPLIGGLLMLCFLVPTQLFLGAVGYVDPYLERKGYSCREAIHLMRTHSKAMLAFAVADVLILLIPFVGWFVAPTYSAVAGIVFGMRMTGDVSRG